MLGTSDAWSTIHLSQQTSELAYYILDWRILDVYMFGCHICLHLIYRLEEKRMFWLETSLN